MSEWLDKIDTAHRRLEERIATQYAVRKLREQRLSSGVDELITRFRDCAELIAAGKKTYEESFEFCHLQAERCVELKNDLIPPPK